MLIESCHIFSFTYFKVETNVILSFLKNIFKEDLEKKYAIITENDLEVEQFINNSFWVDPEKENKESFEAIFYTPVGYCNQTIMISNVLDGWDSMGYYIGDSLNCEVYQFRIDDEYNNEPMNSFTYRNLNIFRAVNSIKEGKKWSFCEIGEPLFFENINFYKNKLVKQRMNRTILIEYMENIGLFITNDKFFEIDANRVNFFFKIDKIKS